MLVTDIVTT